MAVEGRENTYSFESLVSGLMLTADVNGNVVQMKESGEEDQQWMPTISKGYLILKNVGNGKVLDVAGGTNKNGTKVQTYAANSTNCLLYTSPVSGKLMRKKGRLWQTISESSRRC